MWARWRGEETDLLVDFRASRLALERSLCQGEEKTERERRMAGTQKAEGERMDAGERRAGGVEGTRGWRKISVEGEVREREMPAALLDYRWQFPHWDNPRMSVGRDPIFHRRLTTAADTTDPVENSRVVSRNSATAQRCRDLPSSRKVPVRALSIRIETKLHGSEARA